MTFIYQPPLEQAQQILAVAVLLQRLAQGSQLGGIDPAVHVGDLFRAADLESLPRLDGLDELAGLQQGFVRAGVEPGIAAAELLSAGCPLRR
jgi:hypothetical protein